MLPLFGLAPLGLDWSLEPAVARSSRLRGSKYAPGPQRGKDLQLCLRRKEHETAGISGCSRYAHSCQGCLEWRIHHLGQFFAHFKATFAHQTCDCHDYTAVLPRSNPLWNPSILLSWMNTADRDNECELLWLSLENASFQRIAAANWGSLYLYMPSQKLFSFWGTPCFGTLSKSVIRSTKTIAIPTCFREIRIFQGENLRTSIEAKVYVNFLSRSEQEQRSFLRVEHHDWIEDLV